MAIVKVAMLTLHLVSAYFDFLITAFMIPVFLFPALAGYPLGILSRVMPVWIQTYIGFASLFFVGTTILMFFENRYNYLVRADSTTRSRKMKRAIHLGLNYLVSALILIPVFTDHNDVDGFREIILEQLPCIPENIVNQDRLFMLNTTATAFLITLLSYLVILWSQLVFIVPATAIYIFKIKAQSRRTIKLQRKLFAAMCIQALLPVILIMPPAGYVLYALSTNTFDLIRSNLSLIWLSTHGLFSTTTMMIVHRPYREAAKGMLRLKRFQKTIPYPVLDRSRDILHH